MEAPNKIYLAFDKGFVAQASNVKKDINGNSIFLPKYTPIAYIRKDSLLEWANNALSARRDTGDDYFIPAIVVLNDLIDKLNSM